MIARRGPTRSLHLACSRNRIVRGLSSQIVECVLAMRCESKLAILDVRGMPSGGRPPWINLVKRDSKCFKHYDSNPGKRKTR